VPDLLLITKSWPGFVLGAGLSRQDDLERAGVGGPGEKMSYASMMSVRPMRWVTMCCTSSWPVASRRSRVGMVVVSTSPVVRVTSRIHKSSKCRMAGLPRTPMLATQPPARTGVVHSSKVPGAYGFHHDVGAEAAGGGVDEFVDIGVGVW
jgi:hypothetical protein